MSADKFIKEKEFEYKKLWAQWNYKERIEAFEAYHKAELEKELTLFINYVVDFTDNISGTPAGIVKEFMDNKLKQDQ